jgi:hypothetical protein
MANINASLNLLRSTGLATKDTYAVVNALSIIKTVFGTDVNFEDFNKDLRFPSICAENGVIGGLLPSGETYTFTPIVKKAFKAICPSLETPKTGANYVALKYIGTVPFPEASGDNDGAEEVSVLLPNLIINGATFSQVNNAWDSEATPEEVTTVFLAPNLIPSSGQGKISRISIIKAGGAMVEVATADGYTFSFRCSEKNVGLMEVGVTVDIVRDEVKIGQETVSIGALTDLFNFGYEVGMTFLATEITKIGATSLKFKSGDNEYWAPSGLKKTWLSVQPAIFTEALCEVTGENEKDGKKTPRVSVVTKTDKKFNSKMEKAEILIPLVSA